MERVHILSKRRFDDLMRSKGFNDENIETKGDVAAFISINSRLELEDTENPWFKQDHDNVLHLWFEDVTEDYTYEFHGVTKTCKTFTKEQGRQVIDFLEKNKDRKTFIVHCHAGISRSGAVGTFAMEYYNTDYNQFKIDNPHIHPNSTVITILRRLVNGIEDEN